MFKKKSPEINISQEIVDIDADFNIALLSDGDKKTHSILKLIAQILRDQISVSSSDPMETPFEQALREGRAFSAGTKTENLKDIKALRYRFSNPVDSEKIYYVSLRRFVNNRKSSDPVLTSSLFINPPEIDDSDKIIVPPNNLLTGGDESNASFVYSNNLNAWNENDSVLNAPLPLNGIPLELTVPRIVKPGESFGYQISGVTKYLNTLAYMGMVWHEVAE